METKKEYVERYYASYASGEVDEEIKATGLFLASNAKGIVLDCGCGPVPQLWSIFMPYVTEIHAIDLPIESITFAKEKLSTIESWYKDFMPYQKAVEETEGNLLENYILEQVKKIKTVQQADMAASLPFSDNYFDTVVSLYSLGCLKNGDELKMATENIRRVLKPGGKLLHINTNGQNKNDILPAYTWNGMSQASLEIQNVLQEKGFRDIEVIQKPLGSNAGGMYVYNSISLLSATKAV